jgi:hypothetical protein
MSKLIKGHIPVLFGFIHSFPLFYEILGLELRAYTLSHSTSPFFVKGFFRDWGS